MLNTESRCTAALVWATIAATVLAAAWSFWSIPTPAVLARQILDSELALFASRNQLWITGLVGLGGAALAYVLNGWRDRSERRHVIERAEKRDGAVLAREARDLAFACEATARGIAGRSAPVATIVADLKSATATSEHMLLAASATDLARLGAGASTAARSIRAGMRKLGDAIEATARDEAQGARQLTSRAMEAAFAARGAARIFDALAKGGPVAADRLKLIAVAGEGDAAPGAENGEAGKSQRLHSVA